ncbi:hypothetical protein [Bradyrhizobium paxllaeri]|uniref:hypothetical protein n=1 Tax=Bradyrhizobium paxllaeri TaxID=190148 RepID=UPI001FE6AC5E|nr:hypothetical protein [Bradyrhizobium paxllaeri]
MKQVRRRAAKPRVAAPEENEAARRNKAVMDARAEMLRSAPAETSEPTRPAPELNVVEAAAAPATGAAAFVPPAAVADRATDQLTPDHPAPRRLDAETLLAAAPARSDAVAVSAPSAAPVASAVAPIAEAADDGWGWMATWLGVLLMALGLASVLGSSRTLREAVLLRD